ncbi:c(7)-type cytochrome triheme domain-containing protein [Pseudomonadota bacterium]
MITAKKPSHHIVLINAFAYLILSITSTLAISDDTVFRIEFITNYKTFQFKQQEKLIKKSKDIMPSEINSLISDAMMPDKSLGHRMFFLDAAAAMASGYDHYHGGGKRLIRKIDKLIKKELKLEEARTAELMKWKKEERFLGNFVMKTYEKKMEDAGLAPVIYPHWVHRIWFECKVCHQDIFVMQRWRNDISHKKFKQGEQCAKCHNGDIAFGIEDECDRCHIAGTPEAARLHNAKLVDHDNINNVAKRLGASWNSSRLTDGEIPVDKHGFIDWLNLKKNKIFEPLHSLDKEYTPEIRDNKIFFESKSKIKNVLFDHQIHSSWIKCTSCHPEVFKEDLKNNIKMVKMSKGKFCGRCHGKVSFTFADCLRCHSQEKGTIPEGVLVHEGKKTVLTKR